MQLADFDYELPEELIAQHPLVRRDASRMLLLNRETQTIEESKFELLPELVRSGDVIVVNNTRVFPARLIGRRESSGGHVEILLVREIEPAIWEALVRPAHRLKIGARLCFDDTTLRSEVVGTSEKGLRYLRFEASSEDGRSLDSMLDEQGQTPLPAYIRRPSGKSAEDEERYQTVFARERGAIAAPTAGLHFTRGIVAAMRSRQVRLVEITLHVGYGTFEPVRTDNIEQHRVAPEFYRISEEAAGVINRHRSRGGRIIAIGTTTTRALESAVDCHGLVAAGARETTLTITPSYKFRITDALLTNFHLPRSSLLLLVSAFAGHRFTLEAYRRAVAARFRFYSYGDCMFVI